MASKSNCILCEDKYSDKPTIELGEKGCISLNKISKSRGDIYVFERGQILHEYCRKNYLLGRQSLLKRKLEPEMPKTVLRSDKQFNFKTDCVFCGNVVQNDPKHPSEDSYSVKTTNFQKSIKARATERDDEWGKVVLARIEFSRDLFASDALYHQDCSIKFRTKDEDIYMPTPVKKKKGRKVTEDRETAFLEVVKEIEQNANRPYTLEELVTMMQYKLSLSAESEPYSSKHMKRRLIEHFGSRIYITETCGKSNLITLKLEVSKLVENFYEETKNDSDDEKKSKLIKTAAKIIQNDIALIPNKKETYPTCVDLESKQTCLDFLPESLKTILETLIPWKDGDLKKAAIGQALIQAARPLSILAPLQFGLSVQLHQMFGSKMLNNLLNELGFSMSYFETQRFEKSASLIQDFDIPDSHERCIQFMADNIDHNIRTIDGLNTLHGMGMMMTITPRVKTVNKVVPRVNSSSTDVASIGKVNIKFKDPTQRVLTTFAKLPEFIATDNTYNIDFLWKMSWLLRPQTPQWNGMMQMVHKGTHPGVSTAIFLPIIDMDPNNETCIYSTLFYVTNLATKYNVDPIITFDQPLWLKAQIIVETEPANSDLKRVVCRLGGLHVLMSFLGSIGTIMTDSGLKELLQTVYAENAVPHMLTGKAISRAIRGHLLAETALYALLTSDAFSIQVKEGETSLSDNENDTEENQPGETIRNGLMADEDEEVIDFSISRDTSVSRSFENDFEGDNEEDINPSLIEDTDADELNNSNFGEDGETYPTQREDTIQSDGSETDTDAITILASMHGKPLTENILDRNHNEVNGTFNNEWFRNRGLKPDGTEVDSFDENDSVEGELLKTAMSLLDKLLLGEMDIHSVEESTSLNEAVDKLKTAIAKLKEFRTAQLWIEYIEMVDILIRFTKAERTGNWLLHLRTLREMLPVFASTGHNNYTKSVYIYLNKMLELPTTHPIIYKNFLEGLHVVRRSDRYFAGLSTDLIIEQMLMRSLKAVGGLTRGRGIDEYQRAQWILSRPACSEINIQMQELTGKKYETSEQHKECGKSRQNRDREDIQKMVSYLTDRNPFTTEENSLRSIASGVVAGDTVNAEKGREIGEVIIERMEGNNIQEYKFSRKSQVQTMNDNACVKIDGENENIDPNILFQRLITAAQGSVPLEDLPAFFSYELCTYPASLFESKNMLKESQKASLGADLAKGVSNCELQQDHFNIQYVVDGGHLIQKLNWPRGRTYGEICDMYISFLQRKYPKCHVVFDGYVSGPSTKDNVHKRRTNGKVGVEVRVEEELLMNTTKRTFLLNNVNKQHFINILAEKLQKKGIEVTKCSADADYEIVKVAIEYTASTNTVVIGEDTDLLVLLCHYYRTTGYSVHLESESRKKTKSINIQTLQQKLGENICKNILFLHSYLGCDTVSKPSGVGKTTSFRLFKKSERFCKSVELFNKLPQETTNQEIQSCGESLMIQLYSETTEATNMNDLRMKVFLDKSAQNSTTVCPKDLPPTSSSTRYHALRAYYQVLEWKGIEANPCDYGWEVVNDKLVPKMTDSSIAPDNIMKVVRCACKAGCKTMSCTCRKLGLKCSIVCKHCDGSCANQTEISLD